MGGQQERVAVGFVTVAVIEGPGGYSKMEAFDAEATDRLGIDLWGWGKELERRHPGYKVTLKRMEARTDLPGDFIL